MAPPFFIKKGLIRRLRKTHFRKFQQVNFSSLEFVLIFSKTLSIIEVEVREFLFIYVSLRKGMIFYFIHYWFKNRVLIPLLRQEHKIQITKIESHTSRS